MPKHFQNINPTVTVIGQDLITPIGQRTLYTVNKLGDEVREPSADGSVIVRRPVADKLLVDFGTINEEALLTIVADRLTDRAAGEYGNRRIESAARMVRKALEAVRVDSTKPLRKRPQGETAEPVETDDAADANEAAAIQIPGVIVGAPADDLTKPQPAEYRHSGVIVGAGAVRTA